MEGRKKRKDGVGKEGGKKERKGGEKRKEGGKKGERKKAVSFRAWCVFSRRHLIHNGGNRSSSVWLLAAGFPQTPDLNGVQSGSVSVGSKAGWHGPMCPCARCILQQRLIVRLLRDLWE